jgi:hypothetical protein
MLRVIEYEIDNRRVVVHLGWPMSSWLERMSIGVMVYNLMKLPRLFPNFDFDIEYCRRSSTFRGKSSGKRHLISSVNIDINQKI